MKTNRRKNLVFSFRGYPSAAICALALLAAPPAGLAETATIYGSLGNFDVVNNTGRETHGFEIEIEGLQPVDVVYSFSAQRYGASTITASPAV